MTMTARTLVNASTADVNADLMDANYDDLSPNSVTLRKSIPSPYKGLVYDESFFVTSYKDNVVPPALPHSPPQIAVFTQLSPDLEAVSVITTTNGQVMDLSGFYFGCALDDFNNVASVGVDCSILVTGFSGLEQVTQETFSYTFAGVGSAMQEVADLGKLGFAGLDKLTFQIVNTELPATLYSVGLDDLTYTLSSVV
ncbi:hypothetical protein GYMLUDRAFT_264342 [Collybiopsis luxurians FD-317 M1]|uniref:Uncharacterized protein n=1 Tax=Collybiopsis luxurians FD-317 M1 TaxID=944289 RepID=A0A0D0CJ81_9AGAR|nr:hypothetical protein GYMLUDRAFT_264342 [Collybiopsis luxurians FD-317 M1]